MHDESPSATALLIAKSQLLLAEVSACSRIIGEARLDHYRCFVEAVVDKPWRLGPVNRHWLGFIERISIPGMYLHYALRKRCIEKICRDFLDSAQIQQVVVIAGGFDPLAAMLSEQYDDVDFFELDHPATQRAKRAALKPAPNLTLVAVDLTKNPVDEILQTKLSPDKPTLFIAEAITMYLSEKEIDRFFQQIHACSTHESSYFLFTFMNRQRSGSIQFESATWLADLWLWFKKEVFKWGIPTSEVGNFLARRGYGLVSVFDAGHLAKKYLPADNQLTVVPAKGENICLAKLQS